MSVDPRNRRLDFGNHPVESEVKRLRGLPAAVLLVHGFNNDEAQASASYAAVVTELAATGVPIGRLQTVWRIYWQGYVEALARYLGRPLERAVRRERIEVRHSNTAATALLYSEQVPRARKLGEELGDELLALGALRGRPKLCFIAHSLGCRVVLEVIRRFTGAAGSRNLVSRVKGLCLMAAAVPVSMLESGGRLKDCRAAAARTHVLYSRRDTVLRWGFPLGQTIAARRAPEEGRFPRAVGLAGEPGVSWQKAETSLRHGQYWKEPFTAHHLARLFGVVTAIEIPELSTLSWDLPHPNDPPSWETPRRAMEPSPERRLLGG